MGGVRGFKLETPHKKREMGRAPTVQLCDSAFGHPLYEVIREGDSELACVFKADEKERTVMGAVKAAEVFGGACHFTVGDPNREGAAWTEVKKNSRFTRINDFTVTMPDPTGKTKTFNWRHTKDVGGIFRRLDLLNMKLVDEETGNIVARFIHKPGAVWVTEGVFEVVEDLGEEWDLNLFLTCLAVLKYNGLLFNLNVL